MLDALPADGDERPAYTTVMTMLKQLADVAPRRGIAHRDADAARPGRQAQPRRFRLDLPGTVALKWGSR